MPALTPEQEALKQAALAATQGPWVHRHDPGNPVGVQHGVKLGGEFGAWVCDCLDNADQRTDGGVAGDRNAQFIAAANPTAILALLAQIEAAKEVPIIPAQTGTVNYGASINAPYLAAETALQFLADQVQELGVEYGVTLSDGELFQIGVESKTVEGANFLPVAYGRAVIKRLREKSGVAQ
jgi:hypothetical protein